MKVYILTAIDTICNEGLQIFGIYATRDRAVKAAIDETEAYGGVEECDFEFEIEEHEVLE